MIAGGWKVLPKYIFVIGYAFVFLATWKQAHVYKDMLVNNYIAKDSGSWRFNYDLAQSVFAQKTPLSATIFSPLTNLAIAPATL